MNRHDLTSGLFWLGIAVWVCLQAMQIGVGSFTNPGAGFVLFWSGLIFGMLAIVLVVNAFRLNSVGNVLAASWRDTKWINVMITIAGLFLYAALLTRVGFLPITFLFMVMLYLLGGTKPAVAIAGALITILAAYAVFHYALQVQFPMGLLKW